MSAGRRSSDCISSDPQSCKSYTLQASHTCAIFGVSITATSCTCDWQPVFRGRCGWAEEVPRAYPRFIHTVFPCLMERDMEDLGFRRRIELMDCQ